MDNAHGAPGGAPYPGGGGAVPHAVPGSGARVLIWGDSGVGLSEHAWATAQRTGAAWVGNNAHAHITLLRRTVAEELAFGPEQRGVPVRQLRAGVEAALDLWGLAEHAERDPSRLSTGQTRRLAIAAALMQNPADLVLDCPCDGLDAAGVETLAACLGKFPGTVTVYDRMRSPLLDAWKEGAVRTTIGDVEQLRLDAAGQLHREPAPRWQDTVATGAGCGGAPAATCAESGTSDSVVSARSLVVRRGGVALGPMSFTALRGEITHLAGPNGCGKTSALLALQGLCEAAGTLDLAPGTRCGWVPTDVDAAILHRTVAKEVGCPQALEFTGLTRWAEQHPLDLPASERRMVLVAAAIAQRPDVLLLDEPTVGLDAAGYARLADVMQRFARGDFLGPSAVLWTCHEAGFARAVSHRSWDLGGPSGRET